MNTPDLQVIRGQLDGIDQKILELFEERMKLCGEVAEYKIGSGKPVYDREREQQKIDVLTRLAHGSFNKQAVEELFAQMMTVSRRYQYKVLAERGQTAENAFTPLKELCMEQVRVVYQGVEGAYSHSAVLHFFGKSVEAYHVKSWDHAMREVAEGRAQYAVLPIENSSAGSVIDNYDLLLKYHNHIVGETFIPVVNALLGTPDARLEDIHTVFSHPQPFMQCSELLNSYNNWKLVSMENTAVAAKKVMEDNDKTQAAIASDIAGSLYGMKVLIPSINNNQHNTTRFIILSKEPVYLEDAGKISICFELPHRCGSLYNILSNFIYNQINMVMIESRPVPGRNWEYRFFVDLEGNLSEAAVKNALKGVSEEARSMRILGNY